MLECTQLSEERLKIPPLQRPHPEDSKEVLKHFLFNEDRKKHGAKQGGTTPAVENKEEETGDHGGWRAEGSGLEQIATVYYPSLSLHHVSHPTCVCRATDANGDSPTTSSSSSPLFPSSGQWPSPPSPSIALASSVISVPRASSAGAYPEKVSEGAQLSGGGTIGPRGRH